MKSEKQFAARNKGTSKTLIYERRETVTFETLDEVTQAIRQIETEIRRLTFQRQRIDEALASLQQEKETLQSLLPPSK